MRQRLLFIMVALWTSLHLMAQTAITGNVKDVSGEPIIGASVMVAGTNNGCVTDLDGNFSLKVDKGKELTISYVGFKSKTVKVNGNGPIQVTLEENNALLI
jgi:iron complex outermembrane receptor protein